MSEKIFTIFIAVIIVTMLIAAYVTVKIFDTPFAHNTIDYFSFFAALFLIIDGFYKIRRYKNECYFPHALIRHIRIIIGTCIFTIHAMQYVYGV